jgi:membrane-associated PAP2 superfamily phosphatase
MLTTLWHGLMCWLIFCELFVIWAVERKQRQRR